VNSDPDQESFNRPKHSEFACCVDAPQFGRYGKHFDPNAGTEDIEVWIPVSA
jgi:predicted transcriptional regulator YdeE